MTTHHIELETDGKYCGGCLIGYYFDMRCPFLTKGELLRYDEHSGKRKYLRCKACLDSEVKEPDIKLISLAIADFNINKPYKPFFCHGEYHSSPDPITKEEVEAILIKAFPLKPSPIIKEPYEGGAEL